MYIVLYQYVISDNVSYVNLEGYSVRLPLEATLIKEKMCKKSMSEKLDYINTLREKVHPFASYKHTSLDNIYFIRIRDIDDNKFKYVGYVEIEIQNHEFDNDKNIVAYIKDIHIAPGYQRKGIGSSIINNIWYNKRLTIELVVNRENSNMLQFVNKYGFTKNGGDDSSCYRKEYLIT